MQSIEKGTFWLFVSNISFFLVSFLLYFFLGRFLLSPENFGVFTVVVSLVSVITTTMTIGLQQTISKFIASQPENAFIIRKKMLFYQLLVDIVLFAVYFLVADLLGIIFNDAGLVPYFRLTAFLLLFHPLLAVVNGVLNGQGRFTRQAFFSIAYNFLKIFGILLLVFFGLGVDGAIIGFVLASVIAAFIGFAISRLPAKKTDFEFKRIFYFAVPMVGFALFLNLFQNIDLFAVKALSAQNSNLLSGNYAIASTLARLPATMLLAVHTVILPLVAGTLGRNEIAKTRFYIRESMRYSLLFLALCTAVLAASSGALVELIFSSKYLFASSPLFFLAFAYLFFGLFQLLSTVIAGAGKPVLSLGLVISALIISFALNLLLVPVLSVSGAAIASLAAMIIGFLLSAIFVLRHFHALVSVKSVARISVSALVVFIVMSMLNVSGLLLIPVYIAMLALYIAVLWIFGELKKQDIAVFLNMVR